MTVMVILSLSGRSNCEVTGDENPELIKEILFHFSPQLPPLRLAIWLCHDRLLCQRRRLG